MSETIKILRNKSMSVDRVETEKTLLIDSTRTIAPLNKNTIVGTVDVNEQYMDERDACTNYRMIVTIKPYCSNVLFNPCTEIVKCEGSDNAECVMGNIGMSTDSLNRIKSKLKGKKTDITVYDMIRNTEYSKDGIDYEYHPGLDMFNNHILRNKTYRIVNDYTRSADAEYFNTIEDVMRTNTGNYIQKCCRNSIDDNIFGDKKHLYDKDDILQFYTGEAINYNLTESDGWFGFYNNSTIPSKTRNGGDMQISKVINNKQNCEFIDMYPDRTLFSFVPKYNKYRNRLENNWEYTFTYPFESTMTYKADTSDGVQEFDIELVKDGDLNALAIISAQYLVLQNGTNALFFRTATKHNLKQMDKVYIYFNQDEDDGEWLKSNRAYLISGIGDINHNDEDYYFYITDSYLLQEIFCNPYLCNDDTTDDNTYTPWDYVRDYFYRIYDSEIIPEYSTDVEYIVGQLVKYGGTVYITDIENSGSWNIDNFSEFDDTYFVEYPEEGLTNIPTELDRFIKVGNTNYILFNHDKNIQYDGSIGANLFIRNIINNAFTNNDNYTTNDEVNPSANGLWSDYISLRFVKTNGSYNCSYYVRKFKKIPGINSNTLDVESYPLAFSTTIYGDKVAQSVFTNTIDVESLTDNLGRTISEVFLTIVKTNKGYNKWYGISDDTTDNNVFNDEDIEYSHCFGPVSCGFDLYHSENDGENITTVMNDYIDVGTISTNSNMSTIPSSSDDNIDTNNITIDDDWFYGDVVEFCPWTCEETTISDVCFRFNTAQREFGNDSTYKFKFDEIESDDYDTDGFKLCTYTISNSVYRPEGYYYKAHYPFKLRELGNINQGSHRYLTVYNAVPVQMDDIYIMVTTSTKHNMYGGGRVLLTDTSDNTEWWLDVVSIINDYRFIMKKIPKTDANYKDWILICKSLNNNEYSLRGENLSIPSNSVKLGVNTYIWRNVIKPWDIDASDSKTNKYIFTNGCFYIDECINFYLKRQDPNGTNGLKFDYTNCVIRQTEGCEDCSNLYAVDKSFVGDIDGETINTSDSKYNYNEEYKAQC